MTTIQQVLFEIEQDYLGHPYYVSGNAIQHSLGRRLPENDYRQLHASHGVFVPGEFGTFPTAHSQSGYKPNLGTSLPPVEAYDDLFIFRNSDHGWLLDSRPRDALNTHDLRLQGGHPGFTSTTIFGLPDEDRASKRTTKWYVHAYLNADDPTVLPIGEASLDRLQFGGKRNYGYGDTRLKDTRMVDLGELDWSRIETGHDYLIELLTPYVLKTTYPGVDDTTLPWWWNVDDHGPFRYRQEQIVHRRRRYTMKTVDHGQVVAYAGDEALRTALNGIRRVGPHSKYGFGEFRVIPIETADSSPKARNSGNGAG